MQKTRYFRVFILQQNQEIEEKNKKIFVTRLKTPLFPGYIVNGEIIKPFIVQLEKRISAMQVRSQLQKRRRRNRHDCHWHEREVYSGTEIGIPSRHDCSMGDNDTHYRLLTRKMGCADPGL